MKDYDISKWWKEIKKLGYGSSRTEWCEQLMGEAIGSMEELVENINSFSLIYHQISNPLKTTQAIKPNAHPICLLTRIKRIMP